MSAISLLIRQFPCPNDDTIQSRIIYRNTKETVEYIEENPDQINCSNQNGLTPLAVATILGNLGLVRLLLSKGANPLSTDRHQWTPIHFAEILGHKHIQPELIDALKKTDAVMVPRLNYLRQVLNPIHPNPQEIVAYEKTKKGFVPITAQKFKSRTGAQFFNGVESTPERLLAYWETVAPKKMDPNTLARKISYLEAFREYEKRPPELYLDGKNVCIKESIGIGKALGVYGGIIETELGGSKFYRICETNGELVRNLATIIPDGVPNCFFQTIELDGVPRHLLISMKELKAGEKLFVDFGPLHSIKYEYTPISEEVTSFYKKNSPAALLKKLDSQLPRMKSYKNKIEAEKTLGEIGYLLSTPFALIEMVLNGMIHIDEMDSVMEIAVSYTHLTLDWKKALQQTVSGLKFIMDVFIPLQYDPQKLLVKRDILELFRKHSLHNVVRFFPILKTDCRRFNTSDERIKFFKSLKEHAVLDNVVEAWIDGEMCPASAEVALRAMQEKRRQLVIPDLIELVRFKYQNKLQELFEIMAGLELRLWFENGGGDSNKLSVCLESLSFDARYDFYLRRVPHFKNKYPELADEIDKIFDIKDLKDAFSQEGKEGE